MKWSLLSTRLIAYNKNMSALQTLTHKMYYAKKNWWRNNRMLFPSPAEIQFVRIMGGHAIVINNIRHPHTNFPLTFITTMGRVLNRELIKREVRVGAMYIDFAFVTRYSKKSIEIDGKEWHRDIIKEVERDEYLAGYGWRVLHIQAVDMYREPDLVQRRVLKFLE